MAALKPVPLCVVCAQPAEKLKCVKCKTPYCSVACQTVDWKERGHKKECKRLIKANAATAAKGASEDKVSAPAPSLKLKVVPPVVDGPARGRADVARAKATAAAATAQATTSPAPEPEHWLGTPRCPVCLEDWDVNAPPTILLCCCQNLCNKCADLMIQKKLPCPLCRTSYPESTKEGMALLRRNVEKECPEAIRHLGSIYSRGQFGLVPSPKKAARLFQRAADLGNVEAMLNVGVAHMNGSGVKLDKKKAVKYYRMAADRGMPNAQFALGMCYDNGNGVAQDYAEATRLYKLAAGKRLTDAEHNLGIMYNDGCGGARDAANAARCFERAAAKGHKEAKHCLAILREHAQGPPVLTQSRVLSWRYG